ncbi:MAG TPA: TAT-variant-translocated molybdopterin oxidoreductase, partial [Candidatus Acidoferrum sp.]|nr:TAT-variant-translocated molybdopterin oxidoreductase [Candidatus Acidoferrum sp.]
MNSTPSTPTQATGRRYWRSLDELADTPEFKEWLHREFPKGASEWTDEPSRRHFLKIMSASFMLAGLGLAGAGCRRPEEKLTPFGKQPENYTFGTSQYFATAMPTRTGAVPLVVKSYDGRPVKIEGNSLFPGSNGGTDRYAQAAILNLYDPDRARRFTHGGQTVSREEALTALDDLSAKFAANGGEGLAFLAESSTSPSRLRLQKGIAKKFPSAKWYTSDAIDSGIHQRAASEAFGQSVRPSFNFDKAKVILSLDADFLGGEDDCHNHIQKFAAGRKAGQGMSRLYAVESLFTLTGASADHRLRVAASLIGPITAAIAAQVQGTSVTAPAGVDAKWISECAKDLTVAGQNALVVAGQRQPLEVHLLAQAINYALGAVGNTVTMYEAQNNSGADFRNFNGADTDTLVILGGNPVYHLNWTAKPKTVVRLGYYEDETAAISDWNFPLAHFLESWGDARTSDGTLVPVQPLIQPLFGGLTELEFLWRILGEPKVTSYEAVRSTHDDFSSAEAWDKFLYNGYLPGSTADAVGATFSGQNPSVAPATAPSGSSLEVVFYRDSKVDDGFYANNGWMQELPDPITKITWDNAVLVSHKTARELDLKNGDMVEITLNGKKVQGPIWTQPGMADYSLGLALGYGREKSGRVGSGVGFNAYKI